MFKYELHLHTSQGSGCGFSEGKEYVQFYKELGYSGAVVTDHFYHGNTRPSRNLSWNQYIDEYTSGYYDMKKAAEGKDFDVFFGIEERFDCWDEYLIYGLEPEWFINRPELRDMKREEFLTLAKENGALIIQAHPYRYRSYVKTDRLIISPSLADGFEVFNSCNFPEENKLALNLAIKEKKLMTSGSDRHRATNYIDTPGGVILPQRAGSVHELIDLIRGGKAKPMGIETLNDADDSFTPELPVEYI